MSATKASSKKWTHNALRTIRSHPHLQRFQVLGDAVDDQDGGEPRAITIGVAPLFGARSSACRQPGMRSYGSTFGDGIEKPSAVVSLPVQGDVERHKSGVGETTVGAAFDDVGIGQGGATCELPTPSGKVSDARDETEPAHEVAEREVERAFRRRAHKGEFARRVELVVEPRLAPRGCNAMAAVAAREHDPVVSREILA